MATTGEAFRQILDCDSVRNLERSVAKECRERIVSRSPFRKINSFDRPTAAFFLRMPFQPARQLIDAGCGIALASDYNPGSSPSGNMNLVVAMSCIQMKMLPEEAINAATINGAYAMEVENDLGSITAGKKANLIFTRPIPSLAYLPYAFGSNLIDKVMIEGEFIFS